MQSAALKEFLDEKANQYNNPSFIDTDPIQIPHQFQNKEDIEVSAFLTATISWGNRKMIIQNAQKLMGLMGNSPYDYVMEWKPGKMEHFVHRTFNATDLSFFMAGLQHIYKMHGGLESVFSRYAEADSIQNSIHHFKMHLFVFKRFDNSPKLLILLFLQKDFKYLSSILPGPNFYMDIIPVKN